MELDWERLGRAVMQARRALGMSQIALADKAGLSRTAVQAVERGRVYPRPQLSHRSIAQVLGWTADSVSLVLDGGEPVHAAFRGADDNQEREAPAIPSEAEELLDDLSERVRLALLGGKVVDGDVIDLAPDDPDSVAVLILKRGRGQNATPEQMRDDLRKWAKLQRAAREIFSEDSTGHTPKTLP